MFVFMALAINLLPKRQTRICDGHKDLSSVPEAIKFDEKPICVKLVHT